ncbi:MAG: cell surface protein [Muribaculaceae bacterium]|nr:cell surface protein [Muribaculaceae bacterium]
MEIKKIVKIYGLTAIGIATAMSVLMGCSDYIPMVGLGIDDTYYIARMQKLLLDPALTGKEYLWKVDGKVVAHTRDYIFLTDKEGEYHLSFEIIDDKTPYAYDFTVHVVHEEIEYSPYISKVLEYCPAPGQFVNEMPKYEEGDTYADILQKAEESISGTNDIMITLGGYGGYVTFAFDHTVINVEGENDFRIWGNCFYELTNPDEKGGSAEPGIVMVSYDANCNGIADDDWYELAGSEYSNPETRHGYQLTYHRPEPEHEVIADDDNSLSDIYYIRWEDSMGTEGYIPKNLFHSQDYWPKWTTEETLCYSGSCLPPNGKDLSGMGTYYVLYSYPWGYVDNHPNERADLNSFDIGNAVDSNGKRVHLPGIDFIRVYTGVNQTCGWIGETSTELSRAQDLHIALPEKPELKPSI